MPIYSIPEENLGKLWSQLQKLQKRAVKLGVGSITFSDLGFDEVKVEVDRDGHDLIIPFIRRIHNVEIDGVAPKIHGWTFVATLEPIEDEEGKSLGNILRTVPGTIFQIPEKYRNAGNNCDHCHTDRRRNETFVLAADPELSAAGQFKQVGRNCLRDFLGHQSPEAYAEMAQILIDAASLGELAGDDGYDGMGGSRRPERYEAEELLALGACAIRLYGFRSNKVAREFGGESTSMLINNWINSTPKGREDFKYPLVIVDADKQQAAEVYAWLQSLSSRNTEGNDYMYNLSLLGQGATFTTRNFGLAISAIPTWAKEQEREINRRKRFAADTSSQFVGQIGGRIVFTATVVYTNVYESDFGKSYLYKMKTDEGNIIVYFASRNMGFETGRKVALKGTVKKQDERSGVKQTMVTRCALFIPKDAEKAIKKLTHIQNAMQEARYASADTVDERNMMYDAEHIIVHLIEEFTMSGQPAQEATNERPNS